jgi:hypothetical protein
MNGRGPVAKRFLVRLTQSCAASVRRVAAVSVRSLASFNVQGSHALGKERPVQPAPCGVARSTLVQPFLTKLRCTPASVTCQVFSTLAPSMGFSPSEFVLVVSRFSFQSCLPFFLLASALSPRVDVHVAVFASFAVRA